MADEQMALQQFPLEARIDVLFDASDIQQTLTPLQQLELIKQMDGEVGEWEWTILVWRYFNDQIETLKDIAPGHEMHGILEKTDDELEAILLNNKETK